MPRKKGFYVPKHNKEKLAARAAARRAAKEACRAPNDAATSPQELLKQAEVSNFRPSTIDLNLLVKNVQSHLKAVENGKRREKYKLQFAHLAVKSDGQILVYEVSQKSQGKVEEIGSCQENRISTLQENEE